VYTERELKYSVEYYNTNEHKILLVDVHVYAVFAVRLLKTMSVHVHLASCTATPSVTIVSWHASHGSTCSVKAYMFLKINCICINIRPTILTLRVHESSNFIVVK